MDDPFILLERRCRNLGSECPHLFLCYSVTTTTVAHWPHQFWLASLKRGILFLYVWTLMNTLWSGTSPIYCCSAMTVASLHKRFTCECRDKINHAPRLRIFIHLTISDIPMSTMSVGDVLRKTYFLHTRISYVYRKYILLAYCYYSCHWD